MAERAYADNRTYNRTETRGKKKKRKQPAFRKQKKQVFPFAVLLVVIVVFSSYMGYRIYQQDKVRDQLKQEIAVLDEKIESEEKRTEELKEFEIYTHTKKYAEEVAKDILGYVYEDEIIFKPEQ